jgi:hypothetical protein
MGSISSPIALTNGQVFQVAGNKCVVSVPAGGSAVVVPDARLQATGAGADWQGIPYAVSYDLNVVPTTVIDYTGGTGVATQTGKVLLTNTGGGVARFGVFWF